MNWRVRDEIENECEEGSFRGSSADEAQLDVNKVECGSRSRG